jgi:hypothetical protein
MCVLAPKGRKYLQVLNPDEVYFSSDEVQMEYILGNAGQLATSGEKEILAPAAVIEGVGVGLAMSPVAAEAGSDAYYYAAGHPGEVSQFMQGFQWPKVAPPPTTQIHSVAGRAP